MTYYNGTTEGDHYIIAYNGIGNIETKTLYDAQDTIKSQQGYEYDRLGRVLQYNENGLNVHYKYEDGYNLTLLRYDNGQIIDAGDGTEPVVRVKSIRYGYDDNARLQSIELDQTGTPDACGTFQMVRSYDYYSDGSTKEIKDYREFNLTGAYIDRSFEYDTAGRLHIMTFTDSTSDATTHKQETDVINYYDNGLIQNETITNNFTDANEQVIHKEYQYYDNGALHISDIDITKDADTKNTTETFTYDGVGNRTGMTIEMTGCPTQYYQIYDYNDLNQLESVQRKIGSSYILKNVYTYDGRGNQKSQEVNRDESGTKPDDLPDEIDVTKIKTDYTYNFANQLGTVTVNYPDNYAVRKMVQTNSYNADGQRIGKVEDEYQKNPRHADDPTYDTVVNSTSKYYYTGSAILFSTNEDIYGYETENILTPGGQIVASQRFEDPYNNEFLFYNYDYLGSTTNLIDPNTGLSLENYTYDAFGNTVASGDAVKNEIQFTGAVSDASTGLYNMNARYYNPASGRFLSQDTYTGNAYEPWTQHLYSYCGNNPTNFIDPSGHKRMVHPDGTVYDDGTVPSGHEYGLGTVPNKVTPSKRFWDSEIFEGLWWLDDELLDTAFEQLEKEADFYGTIDIRGQHTNKQEALMALVHAANGETGTTERFLNFTSDAFIALEIVDGDPFALRASDIKALAERERKLIGREFGKFLAGGGNDVFAGLSTIGMSYWYTYRSNIMPRIVQSKVFSGNNGYGYRIGKNTEVLYRNPNAQGGTGATLFSYKGPKWSLRVDWDPANGWHSHPPGHN